MNKLFQYVILLSTASFATSRDSVPMVKENQFFGKLYAASTYNGMQSKSYLITEKGDTARTSKVGFSVLYRRQVTKIFGVDIETGYINASAEAPGAKSMGFFNEWSSNLGVSITPYEKLFNQTLFQLSGGAGLNYSVLKYDSEYTNFIEQSEPRLRFLNTSASGYGYYTDLNFRFISSKFISEIGLRYIEDYPKFPNATKAYNGNTLGLNIGVGYQI